MEIYNRIFDLLDKRNILAHELALYLGTKDSTVSNWKQRNSNPKVEFIIPICEFFNISLNYLFFGKDDIDELKEDERELLECFRSATEEDKNCIMNFARKSKGGTSKNQESLYQSKIG